MRLQQRVFVLRGVDATLLIGARAGFGGRPPRRRQVANALARLRRAQDDPFVMAELRRWFTRWQLDPPQLTPAGDAELVRRTVAAIDRGRLVARLVPVARTPATGGGGDERSFRLAQAGGPAPRARTGADLVAMSPAERIAEMLERTIPRLPGHVRDEFVALLVGSGVMRVAAIAAGWIVSHAVGVGEVIDLALAALLVVGAVVSGWAVIEGARDFARALGMAASAASDADLDAAADLMASAVTTLGVAAISILLLRAKGSGGGGAADAAGKGGASTRSLGEPRIFAADTGPARPVARRPPPQMQAVDDGADIRLPEGARPVRTELVSEAARAPPQEGAPPVTDALPSGARPINPAAKTKLSPRFVGTEKGAVSATPELEMEIEKGAWLAKHGTPPPGEPALSKDALASFGAPPRQIFVEGPTKLYRVVGEGNNVHGSYWSREPPPATEAEWRGKSAIRGDFNGNGGYVVMEVPAGAKIPAWEGPIRAQQSSDGVNILPGGADQVFMDAAGLDVGPVLPTSWAK